ncbi:NRDE family protein [Undibacterium oligocarboniphilum]|uniref:NRDE family protein n=1 Tax=Undibacterium oligocarboniphilum TaxID=666702 RepID=A0A850QIN3_9BURK|nr:NRDE family protein [Undibacterium oligocarboniphilum]MBC3868650.1 NRDE family protein [Undibacterium oligocarboniphilum]NVO76630.1 NRDE family protein [Undibacterium oligocarboniphilum]
MCLIVFAWKLIPGTPLLAAANRDEFYDRPAAPASWWPEAPSVYAGRDLQSGGTWLGIQAGENTDAPARKFAAITNVRAPADKRDAAPSRGELVANYLQSNVSAQDYIADLRDTVGDYNGFNLLVGDQQDLIWFSNRHQDNPLNGVSLPAGIYGLSNAALDTCWHKVVKTKAEFASLLCQLAPEDAFFEMLANTNQAPDCRLPDTGVSFEMERLLSSPCIVSSDYGTRVSTLVKVHQHHAAELKEKILR